MTKPPAAKPHVAKPLVSKTKAAARTEPAGKLPSRQEIIDFLQGASAQVGKREIARAFGVRGGDRVALKALLRDMADDGLIAGSRRKLERPGVLPSVTVLEITARDTHGEFVARPATWPEEHGPPPKILMAENRRETGPAAGIGDRVLARITPLGSGGDYPLPGTGHQAPAKGHAQPARHFPRTAGRRRRHRSHRPQAAERVARGAGATEDAENGELVRFELASASRFGQQTARITARLGNPQDERADSLIAVHAHGIPDTFPDAALREADAAKAPDLKRREDLRHLPLVTIDPHDARDHDDAVFAEVDPDPNNKGGWVVIVAIADVAVYVSPGSALDKEARNRGNSVYLPDRVVPMLPERISNDLCSLKESEARACMPYAWCSTSTA